MTDTATGAGGAPLRVIAQAHLLIPEAHDYRLDIGFSVGAGLAEAVMGPAKDQPPFSIGELVTGIANALDLSTELGPVASLTSSEPWSGIFQTRVAPYVTVEMATHPSVRLLVQLYNSDGTYGVTLGTSAESWLKIEPSFTVYDLIVEYDKTRGVDVRARVTIPNQQGAQPAALGDGATPPPPKSEIVSYPFPTPAPRAPNLRVYYVGLGQRFGPKTEVPAGGDPITAIFTDLETLFQANDPTTLLTKLASYYQPERDWFVALDVEVRGWRVRALFNDPALYGLEVTCSGGLFDGLLFEILYQKLAPGLGVYYGALTLPAAFRRIQLGALTLVLPSFRLWIYTNGDFKVCVGWPIGPDSIGVEVAIFTGGGGFYFAKLRSGDNPASGGQDLVSRGLVAADDVPAYAPILEFGLGVWLGLGRSFESGPFSASLSLTLNGTFQGVIAWLAPPMTGDSGPDSAKPAGEPDYHWFAATVGLVGQLQGEVDLKVVKLSVLVRLAVTVAVAFETDYGTEVTVTASVDVEATLTIVFVHITVGFHATISQTFELFSGKHGIASIDGPQTRPFAGMNDWAQTGHRAPVAALAAAPVRGTEVPALPAERSTVELCVLLQPTVVYDGGAQVEAVVGLLIACPPPAELRAKAAAETPMETLLAALERWLLVTYADGGGWPAVLKVIGSGRAATPPTWDVDLTTFLTQQLRFALTPVTLTSGNDDVHAGAFPMFPALQVTWNGAGDPVPFSQPPTAPNYVDTVEAYFAALSLSSDTANPDIRGGARWGAAASNDTGPSVSSFVFDDYFLTVARHVARTLADKDVASADLAREVAGLTSRYLLNSLRLPPTDTPLGTPPASIELQPGYALDGQQIPVTGSGDSYTATLSLDPAAPEWKDSIQFPNPDGTVTSSMPLATPPPEPKPVWNGPGATITVEPLPAGRPQECWSSQRTRLPWDQAGTPRVVVPLPPDVLALTAAGAVELAAQTTLPGTTPVHAVDVRPALAIPLRLHLVPATPAAALRGDMVTDPYLTYVYRIEGTDDMTRARIEQLLAAGIPDGATVDLLYDAPKTGYASDHVDPAVNPTLVAKTNLSTTTAPTLATMLMTPPPVDLGPVSAPFSAGALHDLLCLVWEVSVVHTSGYYLRYETADQPGKPLPRSLFDQAGGAAPAPGVPSGSSAPVTLLVSFPAGSFEPWHDSCVIDAPLPADTGSLYFGPATKAGPVTALGPAYPPGCVAFRAGWTTAPLAAAPDDLYSPAWIASLYHLLRFRVDGADSGPAFGTSLWSVALSETDDHDTGGTSYRQVVPVSRSLTAGPQPYGAVGGRPLLEFRVDDVFGNALDDATYAAPFPVTYGDPILPPGAWSGVRVRYSFQPLPEPSLCLSLAFDPQAAGPAGSVQRQSVLFAYTGIAAQLADPQLALALTTSVLPARGGVVDDGTLLGPALRGFVDDIIAQLALPEPAAVTRMIVVPIDPKDLASRTDDVFAVGVTITMSRPPELVYADALGRRVPGSDTASTSVPPDLDPAAGVDVRLNAFASAFEATFDKFDGTTGAARLLVRTGTPDLAAPGGEPPLWALRWSETHGVWVTFAGAPAYFSMAPLSTKPMAGDAQTVVSYDGEFNPTLANATFADIDVDEWARGFLTVIDRIAAPDAAPVFAAANTATYELLMDAKAVLARALALGVQAVFDGETGGDLVTAQDELEQASLATLGSAYTVSSIVQIPAVIKVAGEAERDAQLPPRFFGPVTTGAVVTTTTAKLPMRATSVDAPSYLTFLVTATEPGTGTDVVMDPTTYAPRFVEHRIDVADRDYGYVPSQWLRVALPRDDDFLDLQLGRVDAPVPIRRMPSPPSLTEQTATQSPSGGSDFAWDYEVGLTLPNASAQDALWLDVTYNLPLPSVTALLGDADLLQALFAELATFTSAWTFLAPAVDAAARAQRKDATTAALLAALWNQVRPVAEAWADLRGTPVPWPRSSAVAAPAIREPAAARTDHYVVSLQNFASGQLHVLAQAPDKPGGGCDPDAIVWPAIDGINSATDPKPHDGCWYSRDYQLPPPAAGSLPLSFAWRTLDALTRQTARTSCHVVRNADLSSIEPPPKVNDAFVYRTAVAAFKSPVVPLLVVPTRPVTPAAPTLAETLANALDVVAQTGSVEADRYLRIAVTYSFRLGADPDVRCSTAVLLANDIYLVPDSRAAEGTTLAQLTASLATNATTWWNDLRPSTGEAELELSVVVFANVVGAFLPLVRFGSIPVAVPEGWWLGRQRQPRR